MMRILFLFILAISVSFQGAFVSNANDVNTHLEKYAHSNETHHDNIADVEHTHSHKHSENGEEHEHHHDHMGTSQSNLKLLNTSILKINNESLGEVRQNFAYTQMASSDFLFSIFRPPIV